MRTRFNSLEKSPKQRKSQIFSHPSLSVFSILSIKNNRKKSAKQERIMWDNVNILRVVISKVLDNFFKISLERKEEKEKLLSFSQGTVYSFKQNVINTNIHVLCF